MNPAKIAKKYDKPLLGQILDLIPSSLLQTTIGSHGSDKHCHRYKTYDQFVAMSPAAEQVSYAPGDRQGISISPKFLADIGLEQSPAKATMSDSHAKRDWQVLESFYEGLTSHFSGLFTQREDYKVIEHIINKQMVDMTPAKLSDLRGADNFR